MASQSKFKLVNLLEYWRNSLADEDIMGLGQKEWKQEGCRVNRAQLKEGTIPKNDVNELFKKAEKQLNAGAKNKRKEKSSWKKNTQDHDEQDKEIHLEFLAIIIAPIIAERSYQHAARKNSNYNNESDSIYPLLYYATLDKEGNIHSPERMTYPWIDRRFLEPNESYQLILGHIDKVDQFLTKNKMKLDCDTSTPNWEAIWKFGFDLLNYLTDSNYESILKQAGYTMLEKGAFIWKTDNRGPSKKIIAAYDELIKKSKNNESLPPLLSTYANHADADEKPLLSKEERIDSSDHHCGHMSHQYFLMPSQREALAHFFALPEGNVLAINGPPGTGKTTLIQSMVMSLWVDKAIHEDVPPLILVSSTNNQAVTNVVDSMQSRDTSEAYNGLAHRWIPGLNTFGLYFVSAQKSESLPNDYEYLTTSMAGSVTQYCKEDFYGKAYNYFIGCANESLNEKFKTVEQIKKNIHQKLKGLYQSSQQGLSIAQDLYRVNHEIKNLGNILEKKQQLKQRIQELEQKIMDYNTIKKAWLIYQDSKLFWLRLPFIRLLFKRQYVLRIKIFLDKYSQLTHIDALTEKGVEYAIESCITRSSKDKGKFICDMQTLDNMLEKQDKLTQEWDHWRNELHLTHVDLDQLYEFNDNENNLVNALDITLRYQMFLYAQHYWEARWLIEIKEAYPSYYNRYSYAHRKKYWQQFAMLMPCFVATLQTGLGFFTYRRGDDDFPCMENLFDFLIIDESGQVNPALAGAMTMLAKRATLIGDRLQLQPISKINQNVDLGNTQRYGLRETEDDYEALKKLGILVSSDANGSFGSAMQVAQRACPYWQVNHQNEHYEERGLTLIEHWRCVPEVINYPNTLAYQGRLISKRPPYHRISLATYRLCSCKRYLPASWNES